MADDLQPFEAIEPEQMLLGELAIHFDLLTRATLESVLAKQAEVRSTGHDAPQVGQILVEQGHLHDFQRDRLIELQQFLRTRYLDRAFAQLVLETGYITEDEVDYAFKAQVAAFGKDRSVRPVGDLLVEFGSIDDDLRDELLAKQGRS